MRLLDYRVRLIGAVTAALALTAGDVRAQSGENVLLVVNSASAASGQIGDHYARARAIPQDNILRLAVDQNEEITRQIFERQIETPIATWINRHAAHDRILYIVLTKGIPLRIAGSLGRRGTVSSVDSELALLYRRLIGRPIAPQGSLPNPYFLGDRPIAEAKPFTHETFDIYLVARLDGFTVADAIGLIDRAAAPARTGRIALDQKVSLLTESGNRWLERSAETLKGMGVGDRVLLDTTGAVVANQSDLLGYYSWGSNDPAIKSRHLKLEFVPGGLAATFVSTDARTFKEPAAEWTLGRWEDPKTFFAGSPQSLAGDLIRAGATGVAGHVAEPYLDATIRPDVLFPAYLSGFNLVESYYLAMPYLGWQTVVVGDPLCAPFRKRILSAQDIDRGVDKTTELPVWFSARVVQLISKPAVAAEATRLFVRAQARMGREDVAGARQALEQATALDWRMVEAQFLLASLYDRAGEVDKAVERYRRVLDMTPANVVALNNLAYLLAVHRRDATQEALALAQKAHTLARGSPDIADTLAWILHLSGNDLEARKLIEVALRGAPNHAQIHLHAAIIQAASGSVDMAAVSLARAVELDPDLEKQPDVQQLRAKVGRPPKR